MKVFAILAAVAGLMGAALAQAAPSAPARAATIMAERYLQVFNRGDRAAYRTFLREHWSTSKQTVEDLAGEREQTGGYELIKVEQATDTRLIEIIRARLADDYLRLELELAPGSGGQVARLSLTPTERPADVAPPGRVSARAIAPLIDRRLQAMGDFSGAVLVAENGRPVYARAGGLADREHGLANTLDTRFSMASMGKMFTAVSIMQLAQAGKLDLDAPIGTYLKDYPNADFARTVTTRQLLTHTGGAGDFMSQEWADNYTRLNTPADYIVRWGKRPPEFVPGSRFSYANYGYIVLGRIIEVISGQTYEDYLRDHVFGPAGMTHSSLAAPSPPTSAFASRYVKIGGVYGPPPAPFTGGGSPAGGAYSTVGDMLAFATALTRHRLLDAEHTRLLLTGKVKGDSSLYAYGFEDRSAGAIRDVGHDGGGPGANGGFRILDDGRAVVVVLSNVAPTWRADKLCAFVAARLRL